MVAAVTSFAIALACGGALTPLIRDFAIRRGLLDRGATSRNIHQRPVPRLGGVAVVIAFFAALVVALAGTDRAWATGHSNLLVGVVAGVLVIAALGVYDDLRGVSARTKFAVQMGVAALSYALGYRIDVVSLPLVGLIELGPFGFPITLLWIAGVVNALNLIDGLDGLAAGVSLVVLVALFFFAASVGDSLLMVLSATLAGGVAAFLFFNVHPASIFMGDTGSMSIGFVLAVVSIQASRTSSNAVSLLVPVIALGYPIADTLLAMARRAARGVPMFSADKAHIHHRLLGRGFSQRATMTMLCAVSVCLCAIAFIVLRGTAADAVCALGFLAFSLLASMRWLGFLDWSKLREVAAARRRNVERLRRVSQLATQLEHAANAEALGVSLAALGPALNVQHVAVRAHGRSWTFTPDRKTNLHLVRYGLQAETSTDDVLEVGWRRGTAEADRDTEIAIERLCPHVRAALRRVESPSRRRGTGTVPAADIAVTVRNTALPRTIIIGAGALGARAARHLMSAATRKHHVVGFVDDDRAKLGSIVAGVPVLGAIRELPRLLQQYRGSSVLLAISGLPASRIRSIVGLCASARASFVSARATYSGEQAPVHLRPLSGDDLLPSGGAAFDPGEIRALVEGKRAMVTGAAGNVGAEICRQLATHGVSSLVMLDANETELRRTVRKLRRDCPTASVSAAPADVRDFESLRQIADDHRPQLVFHAAAHDSGPLTDDSPEDAVRNNVFGALNVAIVAHEGRAERLVMMSSDKAANPTSVAGSTMRIAELAVRDLARRSSTRATAVRFGTVVGANSVATTIKHQIERGGPVTVPHPHCTRRFTDMAEAVGLALLAGLRSYGELCVVDPGEPVRIDEVAQNLITLAGRIPGKDVAIVYTGLRPGERLNDDPLTEDGEQAARIRAGICSVTSPPPPRDLSKKLHELQECAVAGDREALFACIQRLVPTYRRIPQPLAPAATPIGSIHVRPAGSGAQAVAGSRASTPVPTPALGVVAGPGGDRPRRRLPGAGWLER